MSTIVWTGLAIAGMVAMFTAGVVAVVVVVRVLEGALARRDRKPSA